MITTLEVVLRCDVTRCPAEEYGSDPEEVRSDARADGWVCNNSGDYCPDHHL